MFHNHYWGMHFFWWIFWIVLIGLAIYWWNQNSNKVRETPEEILKKRLARGEITVEEYEELKKKL